MSTIIRAYSYNPEQINPDSPIKSLVILELDCGHRAWYEHRDELPPAGSEFPCCNCELPGMATVLELPA